MIKNNALKSGAISVIIVLAVIIAYDARIRSIKKRTDSQQPYIEDKQSEIIKFENYTYQPSIQDSLYNELQAETSLVKDGVQEIKVMLEPYAYPPLIVQKDIPVRLKITAEKDNINSCNNEIVIPDYRISKILKIGENLIEFTPMETGVISYSCWMGMINSTISVVDDINTIDIEKIREQIEALPPVGGCCGMMGR